jgi:hypothetical protein
MPRFWRRQSTSDEAQSPWFVKIKNGSPPPPAYTFQLEQSGIDILQELGLESGDSIPAEQFWALRDLGFTYTLTDSDTDFGSGEFRSENDIDDVENIAVETRIAFVRAVLANYKIIDIESPLFYSILSSLENASKDDRLELVEDITEDTPVHLGPIDGMRGLGYDSAIFGAIVCQAFNEYLKCSTEKIEGDFEAIDYNDRYTCIVFRCSLWDELPLLRDFSLDLPQ